MFENFVDFLKDTFYDPEKAIMLVVVGMIVGGGLKVGKHLGERGATYKNSFVIAFMGYLLIKYGTRFNDVGVGLLLVSLLIFTFRIRRKKG